MKTLKRNQLALYALAGFGLNLLGTIITIYISDALITTGFGEADIGLWTFAQVTIVNVAVFSVLKTITTAVDGIVDVPLAALVDKIHTRWGKRRPAILVGFILTLSIYIAMCFPPSYEEGSMITTIHAGVLGLLFYSAYTLTYVTYYGTFSEVTANAEDRIYLSNWKSFIDTVQYAIAYALIPLFIGFKIPIQTVALCCAPLGLTMLIAVFIIKERSTRKEDIAKYKAEHPKDPDSNISEGVSFIESLKYTFKNKNFMFYLIVLAFFHFGLQMFLSGQNVLASGPMGLNGWQIAIVNTAAFAPVPLMLWLYKKMMKKIGFRHSFQLALTSFAIAMSIFFIAYFQWIPNAYLRLAIAAIGGTVGSFGIGAFFMAPYMIPSQAAAEDKEKNRVSHAPMFFAVQGLVTAGVSAISTGALWPNLRTIEITEGDKFGAHLMPVVVAGVCVIAILACFILPKSYDKLGTADPEKRHCPHCHKDVITKATKLQITLTICLTVLGIIPGVIYAICYKRKCPECGGATKKIPIKMYCPKCKNEVVSKMTNKQIILTIVLFVAGIVPGILYLMFYKKKCSVCETTLEPIKKAKSKVALKPATKRKK